MQLPHSHQGHNRVPCKWLHNLVQKQSQWQIYYFGERKCSTVYELQLCINGLSKFWGKNLQVEKLELISLKFCRERWNSNSPLKVELNASDCCKGGLIINSDYDFLGYIFEGPVKLLGGEEYNTWFYSYTSVHHSAISLAVHTSWSKQPGRNSYLGTSSSGL